MLGVFRTTGLAETAKIPEGSRVALRVGCNGEIGSATETRGGTALRKQEDGVWAADLVITNGSSLALTALVIMPRLAEGDETAEACDEARAEQL